MLSFDLTLIGRAQEFSPYFAVALREVVRLGRCGNLTPGPEGKERGPLFEDPAAADTPQSEPTSNDNSHRRASRHPQKAVELGRIDFLNPFSDAAWHITRRCRQPRPPAAQTADAI